MTRVLTRPRTQAGSVLLYAVLVLVLLAGVSAYFRLSTWPVMSDERESRHLAEADLLADSARNVLARSLDGLPSPWQAASVRDVLNGLREIRLEGPNGTTIGEIRWAGRLSSGDVRIDRPGSDADARPLERLRLAERIRFQVTTEDGTRAVRERELTLTRPLD